MTKVYLSTFGMNAGIDNSHDVLLRNLHKYERHFEKVFVCDGLLSPQAQQYYSTLRNTEVEDYPWDDKYHERYIRNSNKVPDGSWILHLDSDEVPSKELIEFIRSDAFQQLTERYTTLCLPCVLHLSEDGTSWHPVEGWPKEDFQGQWIKNILYAKDETLEFRHFGSHVIPGHGTKEKGKYVPYPYFHTKTLQSFVENDVWQAFLHPLGQQYSAVDARMFQLLTQRWKTMNDFKQATKRGEWNVALQKFAWDRRYEKTPVSRLAWTYFIIFGHSTPEDDPFMTWQNVKTLVLDKDKLDHYVKNRENKVGFFV